MNGDWIVIKRFDNGKSLRRNPENRVLLCEGDLPVGEVLRGSTSAQLYGLSPEDFGDTVAQSSPAITAGPTAPERAGWFGFLGGLRAFLGMAPAEPAPPRVKQDPPKRPNPRGR